MSTKQTELSLQDGASTTNGDDAGEQNPRRLLAETLKAMERARKVLDPRSKKSRIALDVQDFDKVLAALDGLEMDRILGTLRQQREALVEQREAAFGRRREDLVRSATAAGWAVRRLRYYDDIGCFRVHYKQERVTLKLGSEDLLRLDEVDGSRLFARLEQQKERLDRFPFDRTSFFEALKESICLARVQRKDRNGKVLIRDIYPRMVLVLQSRNSRFIKRPGKASFMEYDMAQFVYDLARFGRDGWKTRRGERLSNQGPNMATIAKGDTITLPSLKNDGRKGEQVGALFIQRDRGA